MVGVGSSSAGHPRKKLASDPNQSFAQRRPGKFANSRVSLYR
jgi:hypothetical protein